MIVLVVAAIICGAGGPETAGRLSASDLPAYRKALRFQGEEDAPKVEFRDLWEHDAEHRNRRVQVQGRVARRFAQPAAGRFPALTEFWLVNPRGEPICVVVPTAALGPDTAPGDDAVSFRGTYLRPIRYEASGGARVAPLVVASAGPKPVAVEQSHPRPWAGETELAGALAVLVAVVLLVQFLRKPARRVRRVDPDPVFLQPGDEEAADGDGR